MDLFNVVSASVTYSAFSLEPSLQTERDELFLPLSEAMEGVLSLVQNGLAVIST